MGSDTTTGNRAQRRMAGRKARAAGAALTAGSTALAMGAAWVGTGGVQVAGAATFTVTNTNDTGPGSLRQAIIDANMSPGADTITFGPAATGTISLASNMENIDEAVTIQGPGAGVLTVDGQENFSILYAGSGAASVSVSGLTLTNGFAAFGGALHSEADNLTVDGLVITSSTSDNGGGGLSFTGTGALIVTNTIIDGNVAGDMGGGLYVHSSGSVVLSGLTVTGNTSDDEGGGIGVDDSNGAVTITDSTISGNTAEQGGGLYLDDISGPLTLDALTVTGNSATNDGGGGVSIFDQTGPVLVTGSTISGNTALFGGGLYTNNRAGADFTIENTSITGNTATEEWGGGIYAYDFAGGSFAIRNSTVAGNTAAGGGAGMILSGMLNPVEITNSTVSGNVAESSGGGGILLDSFYGLDLVQSTVTANTAPVGAGIEIVNVAAGSVREHRGGLDDGQSASVRAQAIGDGEVNIVGSIVAGNTGANDIGEDAGTATADHSIIGVVAATFDLTDLGGNLFGVDPLLGPLANNGGPTQTHALLPGSPAIDAGPTPVPTFPGNENDQRGAGFPRVVNGTVDIGAFEVQPATPSPAVIQPRFTG